MAEFFFTARSERGLGRGRSEFVPTVNLRPEDVPPDLPDGIYACRADAGQGVFPAVMHWGERPAVNAGRSCEVHVLDRDLPETPVSLTVQTVARLRDIRTFGTAEELRAQIQADIDEARGILLIHAAHNQTADSA
jgi:riboflavin kinase/FMN adenylyltransferase